MSEQKDSEEKGSRGYNINELVKHPQFIDDLASQIATNKEFAQQVQEALRQNKIGVARCHVDCPWD